MNTFLVFAAICATAFARPDGILSRGDDGRVSLSQSSEGTYKYTVQLKDGFKSEERLLDGTIIGEYTLPSADGTQQIIKYIADKNGFRLLEPLALAPVQPVVAAQPLAPTPSEIDDIDDIFAARSGLAVPAAGSPGALSSVNNIIVPEVATQDVVPVDYTPEVKAAREAFFAIYKDEAARATAESLL